MSEPTEHGSTQPHFRVAHFVLHNSLLLIFGALVALVWANSNNESYEKFIHFELIKNFPGMAGAHEGDHDDKNEHSQDEKPDSKSSGDKGDEETASEEKHESHQAFNVHYLINDVLMALFFAIAFKEVWEACLPGGPLSNPRKAATPLLAAFGGMVGPAAIFVISAMMLGRNDLTGGWAVPCATDIAFSYMVARLIFRPGHPAIAFLLLLAIADDAGGLMILAVFYPQKPLVIAWFGLTVAAAVIALIMKKQKLHSFWWYLLIPGVMSWFSFHMAGIHAALGLVPIIPCLPHAKTDMGPYAKGEHKTRHDTLNEFEHFWKNPVEIFLGLFALANAGVVFDSVGLGTGLVLLGLLVGKPVGITLSVLIGQKLLGLQLPAGMKYKHVITVGMVAAIGFTVALFVAVAAFHKPSQLAVLSEVKMGALASISAAFLAIIIAKLLGVSKNEVLESDAPDSESKPAAEH
jgi:NhaA family Na+:H+ antiporter